MEKQDTASFLRLIIEVLFILFVVIATPFVVFKIVTFLISLLFVSIFVPRNEREKKGVHVRGPFKILTEGIMIISTIILANRLYGKLFIIIFILSAVYVYLSRNRYSILLRVN